ncbi:hypothetical protein H2203_008714 [Taxawa tesnikishii (nom. ined.)]|nr:hypothetical protein H2203_008714 [Dothideales sp. JES 119]
MSTVFPKPSMDTGDGMAYTGNDITAAGQSKKQPQVTTTEVFSPNKAKQNRRQSSLHHYSPAASDPASPDLSTEPDSPPPQTQRRRVSKLALVRLGHHVLTSLLSVAIASLQLATYVTYTRTRHVSDAWPTQPTLSPTVMLMVIALLALALDVCLAALYCAPGKRAAARVERVGTDISSFDAGGGHDLWGWTCSAQGAEMGHVNMAGFNCAADTVAWVLAIAQCALETLGILVTTAVNRRDGKQAEKDGENSEAGSPLLAREKRLTGMSEDAQVSLAASKGNGGLPSVFAL